MAPTKSQRKKDGVPENKNNKEKDKKKGTKVKKISKKEKRTHFKYTEEALAQAIEAIRTKNVAIREACRQYGVPRSTVQDRISGRMVEKPRKVGPEPLLGFDGEQKVVDWIIDLAKCGIPVNKQQLLETVKNIIKDMGKIEKLPEGKTPGQTWYQNFLRRHPEISVREPESINKARESVKESSIRRWFAELESFLLERGLEDMMEDPDRILNGDETGVSLCPNTGKVLAPKGYKNVYTVKRGNEKETLTVLITMTASGKICPPLVVFPYVRPPKAVVENMPEGWIIGKTESGWMRSDVFYEYIANDFNNWLDRNSVKKPVILFVDGHRSHMSMALSEFCENNNIILYALPPNTTHITQPADVSVFRPLKQEWKKTVSDWQSRPENHNSTVTKTNFCKVFKEALDKDLSLAIKNGFRKCGLFPFNVEAVDFTKCVKDFQERRKKISLSSNELTERDFISAQKVIISIKTDLLKSGVDSDIVCRGIELAKNNLKEKRRSNSKTPRTSTEVAKNNSHERTDNLACGSVDNLDNSVLEDVSIPDVGSYVSLNDISLINISDLNFEYPNATHTLEEDIIEDSCTVEELRCSPVESLAHNSKIVAIAEVHNDTSLKVNINTLGTMQKESSSAPIPNNKLENTQFNNNSNEIQEIHEDTSLKVANAPNGEISIDPFERHLKFVNKLNDIKMKRKNTTKFPSAISAKMWRDYYESKEKEKEKNNEAKTKRKMEREQKKIETAEKKRKNADEKKLKTKQIKIMKETDKTCVKINENSEKNTKQNEEETSNRTKLGKVKINENSEKNTKQNEEETSNRTKLGKVKINENSEKNTKQNEKEISNRTKLGNLKVDEIQDKKNTGDGLIKTNQLKINPVRKMAGWTKQVGTDEIDAEIKEAGKENRGLGKGKSREKKAKTMENNPEECIEKNSTDLQTEEDIIEGSYRKIQKDVGVLSSDDEDLSIF